MIISLNMIRMFNSAIGCYANVALDVYIGNNNIVLTKYIAHKYCYIDDE